MSGYLAAMLGHAVTLSIEAYTKDDRAEREKNPSSLLTFVEFSY